MKFEFDKDLPVVVVDVELQGYDITETIRMALDTGATFTMIPWQVGSVLGLRSEASQRKMEIVTASGFDSVPVVTLKSLVVFDKRVENLDTVVHDLPPRSYVDELLGLNFLRDLRFCLDFKKGILEIE